MSWEKEEDHYLWQGQSKSDFQMLVDPALPTSGMTSWKYAGVDAPIDHLFAIEGYSINDAADSEHLVRGDDLVVEFPYGENRPTGIECYWRVTQSESNSIATKGSIDSSVEPTDPKLNNALNIEWWISANTRLLDEQITWSAISKLRCANVQMVEIDTQGRIANSTDLDDGAQTLSTHVSTAGNGVEDQNALILELSDIPATLVLATFPGDQTETKVSIIGETVTLGHRLNFGFLEKGVIRRARILAALLPTQKEMTPIIEQALYDFYRSPLPLTV